MSRNRAGQSPAGCRVKNQPHLKWGCPKSFYARHFVSRYRTITCEYMMSRDPKFFATRHNCRSKLLFGQPRYWATSAVSKKVECVSGFGEWRKHLLTGRSDGAHSDSRGFKI